MAIHTEFTPLYTKCAGTLALMGFADEEIASVLGIGLYQYALWAWYRKDFYDAITPSIKQKNAWEERRNNRRLKKSVSRKAYLAKNPSQRVINATRARIWAALGGRTDGRMFSRLGYSIDDLRNHLESKFKDGMTWDNYGEWHIDHIKPCSLFNQRNESEFLECWSLSNLQPLWASDNVKKGARYAGS